MKYTITGHHAIRIAKRDGVTLNKYEDFTDGEEGLSIREAEVIAADDASLVYCTVSPTGWVSPEGLRWTGDGYNVSNYFHIHTGKYLGPNDDGVEPRWQDAGGAL